MTLTEEQQDAARGLVGLGSLMWFDIATQFTCIEAEAIAEFLSVFGGEGAVFLAHHATGDDEGDSHRPVWDASGNLIGMERNDLDEKEK